MIDEVLAEDLTALLLTAIAMSLEDDHASAVTMPTAGDQADWSGRAERLLQLGRDVAVLASAIAVVSRRAAPAAP